VAEDLPLRHAQHLARLLLAEGHALYAAAVDLGEVAGVVHDEHDRRRSETTLGKIPRVAVEDVAGYVEDDKQLKHERRAADDPDYQAAYERDGLKAEQHLRPEAEAPALFPRAHGREHAPAVHDRLPVLLQLPVEGGLPRGEAPAGQAQGRPAAHGAEADYEPQGYGADKRHDKELKRLHKALVERGYYGLEHVREPLLSEPKAEGSQVLCFRPLFLGKLRRAHSWAMRAAETP